MPDQEPLACTVGKGERIVRGIVAAVLASFAVSLIPRDPLSAAGVGVIAVVVAIMAITGFCPGDALRSRRSAPVKENTLGFPDARAELAELQRTTEYPKP